MRRARGRSLGIVVDDVREMELGWWVEGEEEVVFGLQGKRKRKRAGQLLSSVMERGRDGDGGGSTERSRREMAWVRRLMEEEDGLLLGSQGGKKKNSRGEGKKWAEEKRSRREKKDY